jgi:hypothetical protein
LGNSVAVAFLHVLPKDELSTHVEPTSLPAVPRVVQLQVQEAVKKEFQPISQSRLNELASNFLQMLIYSPEDIKRVEFATKGQSTCARWFEEHHCRISSSNFGTFCKGTVTTNKVKSLLYSGFKSTVSSSAILWGKTHEASAFQQYQATLPEMFVLQESGIHVSQNGFLAASPDGMVMSSETTAKCCGIIEIKCPYSVRDISVAEACKQKGKGFFCELNPNDEIHLKRTHYYYYQIQGSMAIVGVEWCDFIVWTTRDMHIERIYFDHTFWTLCFQQLQTIYMNHILPEIIYPKLNNQQFIYLNET